MRREDITVGEVYLGQQGRDGMARAVIPLALNRRLIVDDTSEIRARIRHDAETPVPASAPFPALVLFLGSHLWHELGRMGAADAMDWWALGGVEPEFTAERRRYVPAFQRWVASKVRGQGRWVPVPDLFPTVLDKVWSVGPNYLKGEWVPTRRRQLERRRVGVTAPLVERSDAAEEVIRRAARLGIAVDTHVNENASLSTKVLAGLLKEVEEARDRNA